MPPMIKRCLWLVCFLAACSSGDEVKIDWKVTFTDGAGTDKGIAEAGSFNTIQAAPLSKPLAGSMATLEIKSDTSGLHFTVLEDGMRRGSISCIAQPGTGAASANAEVSTGGHYLVALAYKAARCVPEQ